MKISMIAAMAHDRVIGKDNQMPWHLPADLANFKRVTLGKPVLMGRKTFESIGRPLPGRRNLVISRNPGYQAEGIEVVGSVEATLALLASSALEALIVIGGGHLYAEMLPSADCLYLTRIDLAVEGDTRFPAFDDSQWQRIDCENHPANEKNPYPYSFETWQRR